MAACREISTLNFARKSVLIAATCAAIGCSGGTPSDDAAQTQDTGFDATADHAVAPDAPPDTAPLPDVVTDVFHPLDAVADAIIPTDTVTPVDIVDVAHVTEAAVDAAPDVAVIVDAGTADAVTTVDGGSPSRAVGQVVIAYGATTTGSSVTTLQLQEPNDLVANAGFESGDFTGWTLVSAGDGWAVQAGLFGAFAAISSYVLESASQTIDLVAAGYTAAQLDASPTLTVRQWYIGGGFNTADPYELQVNLLDGSGTTLASYDTRTLTANSAWQIASNTFTGYPAGVRSVVITTTASDTEFWAGNYGSVIDQASVVIGSVQMRLSNDGSTWSDWAAFAPTAPWTLGTTAGVQTVYVEFRDATTMAALGSATDTITLAP